MVLSIILLIVTGINFTNLYIVQAGKRLKEVGIKKINGVYKSKILLQFMSEIFIQCVIALVISIGIVAIGLPFFNNLLRVNLLITSIQFGVITQLLLTLLLLTLLAGLYPSLIMARFKPAEVLRGGPLSRGAKLSGVQLAITGLQFTFALIFVISLFVINRQVTFMKTEDPGFEPQEVVYIDNLTLFNNPREFKPVKDRIKSIPGVKNVTVASNVPGGIVPTSYDYSFRNKVFSLNTIGVDYDYFETLTIRLKEGHVFSSLFATDSTGAVINEATARLMGFKNPVGINVEGRGFRYKIIGVVKDTRTAGFEKIIQPTIYLMKDNIGLQKTQIMISAESAAIPGILKTLGQQWSDINKRDGDNFNYHFLDELYERQFIKQEQLQTIMRLFSALATFIAAPGVFSLAANDVRQRVREIAIRKVLGATGDHLVKTFSKPYFLVILLANLIAWPVSFFITSKWLETFAYRIHISIIPFTFALIISIAIVFLTVCLQIARAVRFNPALKLKV